jgi:hypothetical protein
MVLLPSPIIGVPVELDDAAVDDTDEEDWAEVELWADSPPAPPPPVDCSSSPPQPAKRAANVKRAPEKSAPSAIRDLINSFLLK